MKKAIFNWSGGKDSAMTLYRLRQTDDYAIQSLLTSVNSQYNRISMHGVRVQLLERQTESLGLPLHKLLVPEMPSMDDYDRLMYETLNEFKAQDVTHSIFGDIFLEDLRKYREDQLAKVPMTGVFPIWKEPTEKLVREFMDVGFKAIIVCVNDRHLDKSFVGREIDQSFLDDLPETVDPCGENGEFHSFVYDGPIFKELIKVKKGEVIKRQYQRSGDADDKVCPQGNPFDAGFWYCDLLLDESAYVS